MSPRPRSALFAVLSSLVVAACGPKVAHSFGGDDGTYVAEDGGDDGSSQVTFSSSGWGIDLNLGDAGAPATNNGPCKGGKYEGDFVGLYTSHLTGVGVPIPVAGNVDMTLN